MYQVYNTKYQARAVIWNMAICGSCALWAATVSQRKEHEYYSLIRILVDPLYVFAFLRTFIDILKEYLGNISAESLKDNFDVVYQVSSL